jgi:two-component system, OmpR family, phosphate regulon sensor histidine kinase PhoR
MRTAAETNRRDARLTAMRSVFQAVARSKDLEHLFRLLHRELSRVLDTTGFLLGLYDEASQMVEVVGQIEAGVELPGGSFPLGHGFLSEVIRSRQPRHIRHWSVEGPPVRVQYATSTPGLPESTLTVPLAIGDRVLGVLSIQSYTPDAYDDDDLFDVSALAAQVARIIDAIRRGQAASAIRRVSKLEAVLASVSDGLLILDGAGRIVGLNPPARDMFGPVGDGIILGQPVDVELWGCWPLGARAVAEALAPVVEAIRRGEDCRDVEIELNSGGRRILSFSGTPVWDSPGQPAGGVVVVHDVTTQREVARQKDDLLSITSHDLRTPLTVLRGQAQLMQRSLRRNTATPEQLLSRVDLILDQTERLGNMLNRLLDLTKLEAGRLDLRLEPMDLVALIDGTIQSVQGLSSVHHIEVETPPRIVGEWDDGRLAQVLQNLITNAIKYSPQGGRIVVRARADGGQVTVSVQDDGLGIPTEDLPHLFERFYRAAGTRALEGSGLGLYICQGIISAHGGRIWVTSEGQGRGSTFSFTLPLITTTERNSPSLKAEPAPVTIVTSAFHN